MERPRRTRKTNAKSADETDDDSTNPPKGRDFDLNQIRSELKGITKVVKVASTDSSEREVLSSDDSNLIADVINKAVSEEIEEKSLDEKPTAVTTTTVATDDIYEFKEPEPFEFDDKTLKKRLTPRLFEDAEKSPKKKGSKSPVKSEIVVTTTTTTITPEKRGSSSHKKLLDDNDEKKMEDPFDKLVESPSFRIVKSVEKTEKSKVARNIMLEEPLSLFKDLEEEPDDTPVERLVISDNDESQSQPLFSSGEVNVFSETFAKNMSDCPSLNQEFKDERKRDSDEDEALKDTIQRITQSTMTDEESSDGMLIKKKETSVEMKFGAFGVITEKEDTVVIKETPTKISPALQESDTSLLKVIYEPQPELLATKLEETKEINLKTGAKVAESILQKFNMLKQQNTVDSDEIKPKESKQQKKSNEKRNRKYVSPEFVDSDSDSSDPEQLIIARSDDDSQNVLEEKPDLKMESDSNISFLQLATATDESQSQDTVNPDNKTDLEMVKEEEPDSNLHSLLLCEETIPGSPAPEATREDNAKPPPAPPQKNKSLMEMPFASVPSSSSGKSVTVASVVKEKVVVQQQQVVQAPVPLPPPPPPPIVSPLENAGLENTPPTTPESSISNLSPRG